MRAIHWICKASLEQQMETGMNRITTALCKNQERRIEKEL